MRMISLRVDSSIVFTLHRHVGAERCHGSGVTGQPFKTWLKDAPVLWRDSRPALMGQPYFHAGELPQQPSELFEDPVAGRTQPWIVGWQIHALLLSQSFAWMLKNVLLLDAGRTFDPQIHDSGEFICRGLHAGPVPECRLGCPRATAPVAVRPLGSTIPLGVRRALPAQASRSRPAAGRPSSYAVPTTRRLRLGSVHPRGPGRARSRLPRSRASGLRRGSIHKSPLSQLAHRPRSAAPRAAPSIAVSARLLIVVNPSSSSQRPSCKNT